jgi:hypothetical protein
MTLSFFMGVDSSVGYPLVSVNHGSGFQKKSDQPPLKPCYSGHKSLSENSIPARTSCPYAQQRNDCSL